MYPLDSREGDEEEEEYFVTADPRTCHGLLERIPLLRPNGKKTGTGCLREVEELFNQVTSAQRIWGDHKLDGKVQSMVILACYDTERFRKFVLEARLKLSIFRPEEIETLRTDDLALLNSD